jgi:hypothetical protein
MLALKPQPTHTLWGNCFVGAGEMRIALIEPHPISDTVEGLPSMPVWPHPGLYSGPH